MPRRPKFMSSLLCQFIPTQTQSFSWFFWNQAPPPTFPTSEPVPDPLIKGERAEKQQQKHFGVNEFPSLPQKATAPLLEEFWGGLGKPLEQQWVPGAPREALWAQTQLSFGLSLQAVSDRSGRTPAVLVMSRIWGEMMLDHLPGCFST